jgi:hypothetical protein
MANAGQGFRYTPDSIYGSRSLLVAGQHLLPELSRHQPLVEPGRTTR